MATNSNVFLKSLGKRIFNLRAEKSITISQLAHSSGFSEDFIQRLENGDEDPDMSSVFKIVHSLDIPVPAFFDGTVEG